MRFLKQRNNYSCGPISIINTLKWAGLKATYKSHYKRIKKLSKCDRNGTYNKDTVKVLSKYKRLNVIMKFNITIDEIDLCLKEGCAVLLSYYYKEKNKYKAHITLITEKINKYSYAMVNDFRYGPALKYRCRSNLKKAIQPKNFWMAQAIIVKKARRENAV